jgi:AcrR family transcriptional regulator
MTPKDSYHHGALRQTVLDEAVRMVAEEGPSALNLRELARRAGVSHAAPAYHFGDKTGVLTAIAAEGYRLLGDELEAAGDFRAAGVAYVRFAVTHRAHFTVMFRSDLYDVTDAEVTAARKRSGSFLAAGVEGMSAQQRGTADPGLASLAAWSLVHGFATLWLEGAPGVRDRGDDPEQLAAAIATLLFRP